MKGGTHIDLALAREVLATVIAAYCRLMAEAMPDVALVLRHSLKMRTFVRRHMRVQFKFNARVRREVLADNPALRRQVRFDLGGKMAMVKWERRRRYARAILAAKERNASDPYPDVPRPSFDRPAETRPRKRIKIWTHKTDRTKGYRMATIHTGKMDTPPMRPQKKTRSERREYGFYDHPIEVTASDLDANLYFNDGFQPPPPQSAPKPGHAPPIDRPPI